MSWTFVNLFNKNQNCSQSELFAPSFVNKPREHPVNLFNIWNKNQNCSKSKLLVFVNLKTVFICMQYVSLNIYFFVSNEPSSPHNITYY